MELNPYQAPEAAVADVAQTDDLAERGTRFGAAFIDGLILLVLWAPVMFLTGYFQKAVAGSLGFGTILGYTIGGFFAFVLVQSYPLAKRGQTWGKRMLSIRIATLDGAQPTLGALLLRRYLPVQLVNVIPGVGGLLGIVNVLFIFRADRRCVHDLIAGTKVVKC
jgi:uncharacterized RDD family membrane protein YckC